MIYPAPKPSGGKRAPKELKRTRMKARNAKRKGSSFPKRRNYKFQAWVRENAPCILVRARRWCGVEPLDPRHVCNSPVRCCHVVNQARGGYDLGNIYGGCDAAHEAQHHAGSIAAFNELWHVDCQTEAARLTYWYQQELGLRAGTDPQ